MHLARSLFAAVSLRMMKHYFWKISLSIILIAYGLKIIFVPTVYYVRYGIFRDYTSVKWPFGGFLIIAGLFVFAYTFTQKAKKNTKKYSDTNRFWMCKTCIKPFGIQDVPELICPSCHNDLERLEGFYERHPELKDKVQFGTR